MAMALLCCGISIVGRYLHESRHVVPTKSVGVSILVGRYYLGGNLSEKRNIRYPSLSTVHYEASETRISISRARDPYSLNHPRLQYFFKFKNGFLSYLCKQMTYFVTIVFNLIIRWQCACQYRELYSVLGGGGYPARVCWCRDIIVRPFFFIPRTGPVFASQINRNVRMCPVVQLVPVVVCTRVG